MIFKDLVKYMDPSSGRQVVSKANYLAGVAEFMTVTYGKANPSGRAV
jgi:hypothetical protein